MLLRTLPPFFFFFYIKLSFIVYDKFRFTVFQIKCFLELSSSAVHLSDNGITKSKNWQFFSIFGLIFLLVLPVTHESPLQGRVMRMLYGFELLHTKMYTCFEYYKFNFYLRLNDYNFSLYLKIIHIYIGK